MNIYQYSSLLLSEVLIDTFNNSQYFFASYRPTGKNIFHMIIMQALFKRQSVRKYFKHVLCNNFFGRSDDHAHGLIFCKISDHPIVKSTDAVAVSNQ